MRLHKIESEKKLDELQNQLDTQTDGAWSWKITILIATAAIHALLDVSQSIRDHGGLSSR